MKDAAIFLCSKTANMAEPWAAAGVECYCVDVQHSIRREMADGKVHFVWGDARSWRPPEDLNIIFVAAFPPCTHVAVSGARDFEKKGGNMLRDALETFEACRMAGAWSGAPYMVENPVGVLSGLPHIGKPDHYFDPCDYGDPWTKKTALWTGNAFRMPEKRRVEPVEGSKMHTMAPGEERADRRSETPKGFANAVFWANAPLHYQQRHPDAPCDVWPSPYVEGARTCRTCVQYTPAGEKPWCPNKHRELDLPVIPLEAA